MKKCYIYTRVSTAAQIEGYSLEAQENSLTAYADYKELQIAGVYCDAGKSGKSVSGRPAFRQMMDDIMAQKDVIDCVLVYKLSRFGRNAADVLRSLQLLEDFGVHLVSVQESIDSSTQSGRLILSLLSAVAEMERENIRSQFLAAKMHKLQTGGWPGGKAPFGYRSEAGRLLVFPEEADIVRRVFELYLQSDMTISGVAHALNVSRRDGAEAGAAGGRVYTYDFVSLILSNPLYCGQIVYGKRKSAGRGRLPGMSDDGVIVVRGCHEAIVSRQVWEEAQEKRKRIAESCRRGQREPAVHVLSGLIACPVCGKALVGCRSGRSEASGKGHYRMQAYYYCQHSKRQYGRVCSFRRSIRQEVLDGLLLSVFSRLSFSGDFERAVRGALGNETDVGALEERLQRQRKRYSNAVFEKNRLGERLDALSPLDADYDAKYDQISDRLDALYDEVAAAERAVGETRLLLEAHRSREMSAEQILLFMRQFPDLYGAMSPAERREMVHQFVRGIEIFPEERADGAVIRRVSFRFPMVFEGDLPCRQADDEGSVSFVLDCPVPGEVLPAGSGLVLKRRSDGSCRVALRKASYAAIRALVWERHGVKVSSLYIAQVKRKCGLEMGKAYNKPEVNKNRVPTCPPEKERLIMEALQFLMEGSL